MSLQGLNWPRKDWYSFWRKIRKGGRAREYFGGNDPLAEKQERIDEINECAVDGMVAVNVDQMDCDCSRWTSSALVAANYIAVDRWATNIAADAEGPIYGFWITKPDDRAEYTSRDLAMEAFEDGHPGTVSMVRYDEYSQ